MKKITKRVFNRRCLRVFFILLLFVCGVVSADEKKTKSAAADSGRGVVHAVVLRDFPPLYIVDESSKPAGFAVDILKEVEKDAGIKIEYSIVKNWATAMEYIRQEQGDIIPGIGMSPRRKEEFLFTTEMESVPISCFVLSKNSRIRQIEDLRNTPLKIAVINQSAAMTHLRKKRGYTLAPFDSIDAALNRLLSGEVDAFIFPEPVLKKKLRIMDIEDRLTVVGRPLKTLKRGYLLRKTDKKLAAEINKSLKKIINSKRYSSLYLQWYGKPKPFLTIMRVFVFMASLMGAWIIILIIWRNVSFSRVNARLVANQKLLENSRENLRITLNSIGDAVIATNTEGRVMRMNSVAEKLTGWLIADAEGYLLEDVFDIINRETKEKIKNPAHKVLETGEIEVLENHTVLISRDGTEYHIADSAAPIIDSNGEITGVVLVFRDVTEEYKMQEQLQQSQRLDAIGQLAGGIAHDFNNMLGGILGAAELLEKHHTGDEKSAKYFSMIFNSVEHSADLAGKLLAFSRRQSAGSTSVNLHDIIKEVIAILENTIDKRIKIITELSAEASLTVGDDSQLQSVLLNLGINASHAMPEGGRLYFTSRNIELSDELCKINTFDLKPGNFIEIEVRDTGCGIEPDNLARIFEPFFTTKEPGQGTGLGLAAAYGTVQQHNGSITVYSEPEMGTCFHLLFSVTDEPVVGTSTPELPVYGEGLILIVDDEAAMRATGEIILIDYGYNIILAKNGREALDIFQTRHDEIDLVLLDMIMPEMNGRDCFYALRAIDPDARIVLSSGFTRIEDLNDLKKEGLAGFIKKPFRSIELSRVVAGALKKT